MVRAWPEGVAVELRCPELSGIAAGMREKREDCDVNKCYKNT